MRSSSFEMRHDLLRDRALDLAVDPDIEHDHAARIAQQPRQVNELVYAIEAVPRRAEAVGQTREVGRRRHRLFGGQTLVHERVALLSKALIIEHHHGQWQLMKHRGVELADLHHQLAVARDVRHALARSPKRRADRSR